MFEFAEEVLNGFFVLKDVVAGFLELVQLGVVFREQFPELGVLTDDHDNLLSD